jgi:Acetyl-CoA acetyltransferase
MFDTTMGWRFINEKLALCIIPIQWVKQQRMWRAMEYFKRRTRCVCFQSQEKYFAAKDAGKFNNEIAAVEIHNKGLINWVIVDEHPRKTSLEKLAVLKPAFKKDGTVTAGNSSA